MFSDIMQIGEPDGAVTSLVDVKRDISAWQNLTIQVIGASGTINISASDYSGQREGVYDGDANTSPTMGYTAVQAVNLATGAPTTSITTDGLYRISPISFKYLRLDGGSAQIVIIFLNKPF